MASAKKKKGGKGLIIGLVLLLVFGGAGAVFGLALTGKINIPGVTPKKKPTPAAVADKPKPKIVVPPKEKKEEPPVETAKTSPVSDKQGAVKLAEVWNEMSTDKLSKMIDKWKPTDLAFILNEMDPTKVADILASMKPVTASNVSREMQKLAAQLPAE